MIIMKQLRNWAKCADLVNGKGIWLQLPNVFVTQGCKHAEVYNMVIRSTFSRIMTLMLNTK